MAEFVFPPVFLVYWRSDPVCGWCSKAKTLLDERHIPYIAVDIAIPGADRDTAFERLKAQRWGTVPAIFELDRTGEIKGFIGGYENLVKELEQRI